MKPKDERMKQYLPKRQHWSVFLYSVRPLPLRNPLVPDFDSHAQTILGRLNLADASSASIGHALDAVSPGRFDEEERCYRFAVKQILFGYSLLYGWTFWARFEEDSDLAILPRSVFESCYLRFCSDFETAKYGSLTFRFMAVDRMDQSDRIGQPDYHPRVLRRTRLLRALVVQPQSRELDCKFESIRLMDSTGDLSNNVRSLSKEALRVIYDGQSLELGNRAIVEKENLANGAIEEIISGNQMVESGKGGRPSKDPIIEEAFFTWLLKGRFCVSLTKRSVIDWVLKTNAELRVVGLEKREVSPRKVDLYLKDRSYWDDRKWMPENWDRPFRAWKVQKLTKSSCIFSNQNSS